MKTLVVILLSGTLLTGKFIFDDLAGCNSSNRKEEVIVKTDRVVEKEVILEQRRTVKKIPHKTDFPNKHWKQYTSVSDAGFSQEKLTEAENYFKANNGSALLIIHEGKVVMSSGEPARRFMMHSMRKSLVSALFGININKIDTGNTLARLGINDTTKLSEVELQARVIDLLAGRSGIYLPSAYAPADMQKNLPIRGSSLPNINWFYNNWDFNALGTIFKKTTSIDLFDAFKNQLAGPLQMEDYRDIDGYYKTEPNKSLHPAYLFKMSARDLARFGLLYLNNGKWKGKQIVPESWVNVSTSARTTDLGRFKAMGSFGLLWWISNEIEGEPMFYASGIDGHKLCIFPNANLIVVHRTNTYQNVSIKENYIDHLLSMILKARINMDGRKNRLKTFGVENHSEPNFKIRDETISKYIGQYRHPAFGVMKTFKQGNGFLLDAGIGYFTLLPVSENEFWAEDMNVKTIFKKAEASEKPGTIKFILNKIKEIESAEFYY